MASVYFYVKRRLAKSGLFLSNACWDLKNNFQKEKNAIKKVVQWKVDHKNDFYREK